MMTSKKAPGFYAGMLACVLAIAAAVCYGVVFPGIEYKEQVFDIRICVILAAAGFAPALLCLGSGVALMLFINIAIWPVSDTIYGIEPFPQITQLVVCAALIAAALVVGEIALYLRKYRPA